MQSDEFKSKYLKYKQKYIQQSQSGGNHLCSYGGSGIVLFEPYSNGARNEMSVILFLDSKINEYDIAFSKTLLDYNLRETAQKELLEKSCGLLNFKTNAFYVDYLNRNNTFRCYYVKLLPNLINLNDYNINCKILKERTSNLTTTNLERFYLSDLNIMVNKGITKCLSVDDPPNSSPTKIISHNALAYLSKIINNQKAINQIKYSQSKINLIDSNISPNQHMKRIDIY